MSHVQQAVCGRVEGWGSAGALQKHTAPQHSRTWSLTGGGRPTGNLWASLLEGPLNPLASLPLYGSDGETEAQRTRRLLQVTLRVGGTARKGAPCPTQLPVKLTASSSPTPPHLPPARLSLCWSLGPALSMTGNHPPQPFAHAVPSARHTLPPALP